MAKMSDANVARGHTKPDTERYEQMRATQVVQNRVRIDAMAFVGKCLQL